MHVLLTIKQVTTNINTYRVLCLFPGYLEKYNCPVEMKTFLSQDQFHINEL